MKSPLEQEVPKHQKRGRRKSYTVVYRMKPEMVQKHLQGNNSSIDYYWAQNHADWMTFKRYSTEAARAKGMESARVRYLMREYEFKMESPEVQEVVE